MARARQAASMLASEADDKADKRHLVSPYSKAAIMLPYQAIINASHLMILTTMIK
jgi:hypothetical protein